MSYIFYVIIGLGFTLFQTVMAPNMPVAWQMYDIVLVMIIYIGLFRPAAEGIGAVVVLGMLMDGLAGSPFWTYTTTYFWLLVIVKWLIQFLNAGSVLLFMFAMCMGIVLENSILMFTAKGVVIFSGLSIAELRVFISQVIWGAITGPLFIICMKKIHNRIGVGNAPQDRSEKKKNAKGAPV